MQKTPKSYLYFITFTLGLIDIAVNHLFVASWRLFAIIISMVHHKHIAKIGRGVRRISRLRGGNGSALPGLIVEKLDPQFAKKVLDTLPYGVVIVSGTNGKTTTTKMVSSLLQDCGLKVFTNRTGSNFTRGVIASLLTEIDKKGNLNADIAVLELDEAYAARFVKLIKPRYSLLLNVMRDQLDRFGEIDHTAKLLAQVAAATTHGVVLNRDDPLISKFSKIIPESVEVRYFGLSTPLLATFPSDQNLHDDKKVSPPPPPVTAPGLRLRHAPAQTPAPPHTLVADVTLEKLDDHTASFRFGSVLQKPITLKIDGLYNVQNAAAALATARIILGAKANDAQLLKAVAAVKPAFGRGESVLVGGEPLEIVLVKNPAGFRLALNSYAKNPARTMIAINDNYADGRDMSWLWDVDFSSLKKVDIVSGIRAYDMALRLQYDDVEIGDVDTDLATALTTLLRGKSEPRRIFCTYTAMMSLRKLLARRFGMEEIGS